MIGGQKISLRIFSGFPMSCANFAYRSYRKPLRTAISKIFKSHLTPIYIFRGPISTTISINSSTTKFATVIISTAVSKI